MLKTLHLTLREYDTMVRKGAFDELGRRVELIRGEIVEMNPSGPVHEDRIEPTIGRIEVCSANGRKIDDDVASFLDFRKELSETSRSWVGLPSWLERACK